MPMPQVQKKRPARGRKGQAEFSDEAKRGGAEVAKMGGEKIGNWGAERRWSSDDKKSGLP